MSLGLTPAKQWSLTPRPLKETANGVMWEGQT